MIRVSYSSKKTFIVSFIVLSLISLTSIFIGKVIEKDRLIKGLTEPEKISMVHQADPFNKEAFVKMLKDINIKFPHIIMAQSIVETGKWESRIFLENNNLFGMKETNLRVSTAKGTRLNHAWYNHWRESVYDYAFYQSKYTNSINTESEYYEYLNGNYAESKNYVNLLKQTVKKENLKELFN